MPHTIEHKIKVLNRPATPPPSPDYQHHQIQYEQREQQQYQFPTLRRQQNERERGEVGEERRNWMNTGDSRASELSSPSAPEKPARTFRQHTKSSEGDVVTFGTETFERNLRYSPNEIERQHFSTRSFGDRQSQGADGESRASVHFEDDMQPAQPIGPTYDNPRPFAHPMHREMDQPRKGEEGNDAGGPIHLMHRDRHLDTTPIRIPRPKWEDGRHSGGADGVDGAGGGNPDSHHRHLPSPFSFSSTFGPSRQSWRTATSTSNSAVASQPRRAVEEGGSMKSNKSSGGGTYWTPPPAQEPPPPPMKKVIRKSRWVSIHDGRPVTKFVETVHYVPADEDAVSLHHHHAAAMPSASPSVNHQPQRHFGGTAIPDELYSSCSSCSVSSADEREETDKKANKSTKHHSRQYSNKDGSAAIWHQPPIHSSTTTPSQPIYVTHNPVYSLGA